MEFLLFMAGAALGALGMWWMRDRHRDGTVPDAAASAPAPASSAGTEPEPPPHDLLFQLKREVEAMDERIQHPRDLLDIPEFARAVELLSTSAFTPAELVEYLGTSGYVLPCMAARAMSRRTDVDATAALRATSSFGGYPLRFVLDYLQGRDAPPPLGELLRHARPWWWEARHVRERLRDFFQWASARSPETGTVDLRDLDEDELAGQERALSGFGEPLLAPYLSQLDAERTRRREQRILEPFGRIVRASDTGRRFGTEGLSARIDQVLERLRDASPSPVLLVGEPGVGKTTLADAVCENLLGEGWLVFEASAADVLAGQKFIGELEGRVRDMLSALSRPRALWRVEDFADLLAKGAHSQDPRGILDLVMPAMERGQLLVLGACTPPQYAQLLRARPGLRHAAHAVAVPPANDAERDEIARQWAAAAEATYGAPVAGPREVAEATTLAAQFFPEQQEPGRVLRLLDQALKAAVSVEPIALPLSREALLAAVAARSGLPLSVVDDRQSLDLDALRAFFRARVLGQDEAVECLVDRIAMLKAGLVDSERPIGVFLFAGPTGTGKTELAKALGELLFGSADRLLRLDMSEYQSEDSAWRLLGEGGPHDTVRSLTARIREQPFSVVLLDEFEKAHPKVWDLFLQVFDDARLSDRSGHAADFRHTIIILTSNVGSTLSRSAGPGFTSTAGGYSRSVVEKALNDTFRREFLNRLDRIVLFQPLDRNLMRGILHKELQRTLDRRGLRMRDWAVEWEPSAIEFLLDRGFTPDLGARPLRRAIEHHLLAPLARVIVEHRAPEGGQFLFVRSDGQRLEVEFVDPDAPAADDPGTPGRPEADLRSIVHAPDRDPGTVAYLGECLETLRGTVGGTPWGEARDADYARMAAVGFWDDPDRFAVLDRIERRDRIESALSAAERMARRIAHDGGSAEFIGRLAQLAMLLQLGIDALLEHRPQDALLEVSATGERATPDAGTRLWWQDLLEMYRGWARRRNMRLEVLAQDPGRCVVRLAVGGFGAFDVLQSEAGLHVLEQEREDGSTRRIVAQVRVAPDLPGQARRLPDADAVETRICRRYRAGSAPLVRDGARGWRTGRLDRVLAGDFDIIPHGRD